MEKARVLNLGSSQGEIVEECGFGDSRKTKAVIRKIYGESRIFVSGAPEEIFTMVKRSFVLQKRIGG